MYFPSAQLSLVSPFLSGLHSVQPDVAEAYADDGKEIAESDRQVRGFPRAHAEAAGDAGKERGKAGGKAGPDLPAGAEIREGHEPHRREPASAHRANSEGAGILLFRWCGGQAGRGRVRKTARGRLRVGFSL